MDQDGKETPGSAIDDRDAFPQAMLFEFEEDARRVMAAARPAWRRPCLEEPSARVAPARIRGGPGEGNDPGLPDRPADHVADVLPGAHVVDDLAEILLGAFTAHPAELVESDGQVVLE